MRWEKEKGIYLLNRHLTRLSIASHFWGIQFDEELIRKKLALACEKFKGNGGKIRLLVDFYGKIEIQCFEMNLGESKPVNVVFAKEAVDDNSPFLYHKTTKRDIYERAKEGMDHHPEAQDVILWNSRGEVTETTIANIGNEGNEGYSFLISSSD